MLVSYKSVNIYQANSLILENINFQVSEGELIYLIGKVGSGKSSLLKTIYCELDLEQGDVEIAEVLGRNLVAMKRKDVPALRKEMGIIFQDFQLLHDRTVFQNLYFVLLSTGWKDKNKMQERIEEVLASVGMEDKENCMPYELSGGEQQRIAIARAILNNPKMIIADEPTGNLDPETAEQIVGVLKNITQSGTSVVMATHNISMINQFPGIVYRCVDKQVNEVTHEFNQMKLKDED